jgi:Leucine-rich repeat (LRR) protein
MAEGRKPGAGITKSLILSATTISKNRSQTMDSYLSHITHLHLQSRKLRAIENLESCTNLKVLYLYDNKIEEINHLDFAKGLSYLYLENNCIRDLPDLSNTKLKKLFLDENELSLIRGLHQCTELVVLSVARQRLPRHKFLSFDPMSLEVISHTLETLDISGNAITSLAPFKNLYRLQKFFASDNNISDVGEIEGVVILPRLEEVNFKRNPCCTLRRYRDFVIGAASNTLRVFDDIPISSKNIESVKGIQRLRRRIGLVDHSIATTSTRHDDFQSFEEPRNVKEGNDDEMGGPDEVGQPAPQVSEDEFSVGSDGGRVVNSNFVVSEY